MVGIATQRVGPRGLAALPRALVAPETWVATIYVTWGYVVGAVSFSVALAAFATAASLSILIVGLPLLWLTLLLSHGVAVVEQRRADLLLGARVETRPDPLPEGSWPARMWARITSPGAWLELCYGLVVLPLLAWPGGLVVFSAWGGGLAFILFPAYGWALPIGGQLFGWELGYAVCAALHAVIGAVLLLAAPWLARGIRSAQVGSARLMLSPNREEQLTRRVETLQETRTRMVAAADTERRRIERDLHDGAQQRLVALAMTLGRANTRFEDEPDAARELVAEAHGEAKQALIELRNLARGIHPAVLSDRGLDAALSALAARSPVPVEVSVDLPRRPDPALEAVAYFIVAEALTNVARHARATKAWVNVHRLADRLVVEVGDDGHGTADPVRGTGLAGLRDRARAVDGDLTLNSPAGGPTILRAELPCES
ncbi:MAG: sensor histidine kinase [Streptosporangiaceae bacterium]